MWTPDWGSKAGDNFDSRPLKFGPCLPVRFLQVIFHTSVWA